MPESPPRGSPNATWADLKQLGWALLLVYPFLAVTAYFARGLLGVRTAIWFGVGLAALATVAFGLVVVFSLVASYVAETPGWLQRRRARSTRTHLESEHR